MCDLLPNGRWCYLKLHLRETVKRITACETLCDHEPMFGGEGEGSTVQLVPKTAGGVGARATSSLYHEGGGRGISKLGVSPPCWRFVVDPQWFLLLCHRGAPTTAQGYSKKC